LRNTNTFISDEQTINSNSITPTSSSINKSSFNDDCDELTDDDIEAQNEANIDCEDHDKNGDEDALALSHC
jgi:hypothetical protein